MRSGKARKGNLHFVKGTAQPGAVRFYSGAIKAYA